MFEIFTVAIAAIVVAGVLWGVVIANDTLHPLVYLLPMVGFFYVYMPLDIYREGALLSSFTREQVLYVQAFNFLCVLALAAGACWGSRGVRRDSNRIDRFSLNISSADRLILLRGSLLVGGIGMFAYLLQLHSVGGFYAAYSVPKGGGWSASGYLRELDLLLVSAITLIYLANSDRAIPASHKLLISIFSAPLVLRGLLTARRGPTFLILVAVIGGWYLVKGRRPSFKMVVIGGGSIGLLLLLLVTYRSEIYLGSEFFAGQMPTPTEMVENSFERSTKSGFGNEFMYGSYVVVNAQERSQHYWGSRYLTQLLVRPIPRRVWPDKYEDVGMKEIEFNAGQLGSADSGRYPEIPRGSAPGFAGSAYVEWAWGGAVFILFLGWFYGYAWKKALTIGGSWSIVYVSLMSTSVYFIAQSFLAVLFRLLFMSIPPILVVRYVTSRISGNSQR